MAMVQSIATEHALDEVTCVARHCYRARRCLVKITTPCDDHSTATEHPLSVTCTAFMNRHLMVATCCFALNMVLQISSCSHDVRMMVMRMTTMMMRDVTL